jgi:hypothetical protein
MPRSRHVAFPLTPTRPVARRAPSPQVLAGITGNKALDKFKEEYEKVYAALKRVSARLHPAAAAGRAAHAELGASRGVRLPSLSRRATSRAPPPAALPHAVARE